MSAADMHDLAAALRWALRRIERADLGVGEYFERAEQMLSEHERRESPTPAAFALLYLGAVSQLFDNRTLADQELARRNAAHPHDAEYRRVAPLWLAPRSAAEPALLQALQGLACEYRANIERMAPDATRMLVWKQALAAIAQAEGRI